MCCNEWIHDPATQGDLNRVDSRVNDLENQVASLRQQVRALTSILEALADTMPLHQQQMMQAALAPIRQDLEVMQKKDPIFAPDGLIPGTSDFQIMNP
jgi:hypothetical protein